MGPVHVHLNPFRISWGEIEERANNTAGVLEVPPFTEMGSADSFFDVFVMITVETPNGPIVLLNHDPKVMRTVIFHKPPEEGATYESPETIRLFHPDGTESEFSLGPGNHVPDPLPHFVEHDVFEKTLSRMTILDAQGNPETVVLEGRSAVEVWFERNEGEAQDDDNNGRDEVMTRMVEMELKGTSSMGPITVRLNPAMPSWGMMEEQENATPGILDLPPFTETGRADSFFDVFVEIEVETPDGSLVVHNQAPKVMRAVIHHKPPPGAVYEGPETVELLLPNGEPAPFSLGPATNVPEPFVEHDLFKRTFGRMTLIDSQGNEEEIIVVGPIAVDVHFESTEGAAVDHDGDGLEEVTTRVVEMDLMGRSSLGRVRVRLNPNMPGSGGMVELENATEGVLDVLPFAQGGAVDSFFDIFVEIRLVTLDGQEMLLHNQQPKRLSALIDLKPARPGTRYVGPEPVELFLPDGESSGFSLGHVLNVPNPPNISSVRRQDGKLQVGVPTRLGFTYVLEYKNHAGDPEWKEVGASVDGTGDETILEDPNPVDNSRLYRVKEKPVEIPAN